jgi:hypothetical protein
MLNENLPLVLITIYDLVLCLFLIGGGGGVKKRANRLFFFIMTVDETALSYLLKTLYLSGYKPQLW